MSVIERTAVINTILHRHGITDKLSEASVSTEIDRERTIRRVAKERKQPQIKPTPSKTPTPGPLMGVRKSPDVIDNMKAAQRFRRFKERQNK